MGMAGIEHGIGEIVQGNTVPQSLVFPSWPHAGFFSMVAGEPAMSLVPNLLVSGIFTLIVAGVYIYWAFRQPVAGYNTGVQAILAIVMLMVGGGIFPPLLAFGLAFLAGKINHPLSGGNNVSARPCRNFFCTHWRLLYTLALAAWLMLFPGLNLLGYFLGIENEALTIAIILLALVSLPLVIFSAFVHDAARQAALPAN